MENRAYASHTDLRRMIDLLMVCRQAQPTGDYQHVGDLLWGFRRQSEPERNVRLWEEEGKLAGFVVVDLEWRMVLHQAYPEATDDLRRELFDWGTERIRQGTREKGGHPRVSDQAREDNTAKIAFLETEGFTRGDHYFVELLRPLDRPIPVLSLPEGFTIRHLTSEDEIPAYVDMHRDAWSAWAPSSYSAEQHRRLMHNPGYDVELTPIVVAPDGTLVSYCIGWLDPVNTIGEIEPLGTRPGYARMGLARAVVFDVLRRMREQGMETALA